MKLMIEFLKIATVKREVPDDFLSWSVADQNNYLSKLDPEHDEFGEAQPSGFWMDNDE